MYNDFEKVDCSCMEFVAVDSTCAAQTSRTVNFCCSTNLTPELQSQVNENTALATILYDLNNLFCTIEPCCDNCCKKFDIRVVGSIPFILNAPVSKGTNQCSTAPDSCPIKVACSCVVPVNNVICNVCSYEEAIKACAYLAVKLRSCSCVTATIDSVTTPSTCTVRFNGHFTLPDCSAPVCVSCTNPNCQ